MENRNQDWHQQLNLKELFDANVDVRDSYIPENWKLSFNDFMFGSTCYMEEKLDGSGDKEFVYYSHDFRNWYFRNKVAIERDLKISGIID